MANPVEISPNDALVLKCDKVLAIQVIALDTKTRKQSVKSNLGNLEKAYKKIIKPASFYAATFNFFTEEAIQGLYLGNLGREDNRLVDAKINYISAKPLAPKDEFKGSYEDYQKKTDDLQVLQELKSNNNFPAVKKAIKEVIKGNDFIESLLKAEMASYPGKDTPFLLVCGRTSAEISTTHLFSQKDEKCELGSVSLLRVGGCPLKIGNIDFPADLLADQIIYNGSVSNWYNRQGCELSDPQFLLVNRKLEPLSSVSVPKEKSPKKNSTTYFTVEGTTSSSIKTLQIIGVDEYVLGLLQQNAGHVEDVYPEIVKRAVENKSMIDGMSYFTNESEIVAKFYRFYFGSLLKEADDDVRKNVKNIPELRGDDELWRTCEYDLFGKNAEDDLTKRMITRLLTKKLWGFERFLLIVGDGSSKDSDSGSSQFEMPVNTYDRYCDDYDSLTFIDVNEDVEIGSLKFHTGILADHVFIMRSSCGDHNDTTDNNEKVLANPQFQLVDTDCHPIDIQTSMQKKRDAQFTKLLADIGKYPGSTYPYYKRPSHEDFPEFPTSINVQGASRSSIKYLQIIYIDNHIRELLEKSAGHVENVYPEIAEYDNKRGKIRSIRFFSDEKEIVVKAYDVDLGEEIDANVKTLYVHDLSPYENRVLRELPQSFTCTEWTRHGLSDYLCKRVRREYRDDTKEAEIRKKSLFFRMIDWLVRVDAGEFLLVLGDGSDKYSRNGSSYHEIFVDDTRGRYDGHFQIGVNEDVEIGSLKFHVATIADHAICNGVLYGPNHGENEDTEMITLNNPQFQCVDELVRPIAMPGTEK